MNLNTEKWKYFKISDLFEDFTGGDLIIDEIEDGNIPIASNSVENNNIKSHSAVILNRRLFDHTISISIADRGKFWAFIQPKDFYIGTRVKALVSKYPKITIYQLAFITTVINQESFKFCYGRNCCKNLPNMIIRLPIQYKKDDIPFIDEKRIYSDNGYIPDWNFMENYIKSLHHKPITTENKPKNNIEIVVNKWKEFALTDIFKLQGGFYNKKPEHSSDGTFPFLASTDSNNGVTEYYNVEDIRQWSKVGKDDDTLDKKIYKGNSITVTVDGSVCNAYYQKEEFTCSHSITVLYLKDRELNPYIALFLCTIIMMEKYRWSYGRKPHSIKKFGKSIIKLPVDTKDKPDWQFMETYIKSLPFGDRI